MRTHTNRKKNHLRSQTINNTLHFLCYIFGKFPRTNELSRCQPHTNGKRATYNHATCAINHATCYNVTHKQHVTDNNMLIKNVHPIAGSSQIRPITIKPVLSSDTLIVLILYRGACIVVSPCFEPNGTFYCKGSLEKKVLTT